MRDVQNSQRGSSASSSVIEIMLLFALVATALVWMHVSIRIMEHRKIPELRGPKYLPELEGVERS